MKAAYAFLFIILGIFVGGWYLLFDAAVVIQETKAAYQLRQGTDELAKTQKP